MALVNTVYPPEMWANESLMVLRDELVMAGLVHRSFEPVVANVGDTVHTRKPTKFASRTWAGQTGSDASSQIEVDNPNARNITVTLDTLAYVAYLVEDRDQTVAIKDLFEEFLLPATDPISQRVDDDIMTEFTSAASADVEGNAVSAVAFDTVGLGADLNEDDIIAAREQLSLNQCPLRGRVLVLSPQHDSDALRVATFVQADQSGTRVALEEGRLGRKFGFDIHSSQNVPVAIDTDSTPQSLAFHRSAIALVTRPLSVPNGVAAAVASLDGLSIRVIEAYDVRYVGTVRTFMMLYGVQLLDANLAVIINP